jgi:ATP-binding protein involved in chromosome partitioning
MASVDEVLQMLSTVIDPDLKKDIVSMGMIKDLEISNNDVKFTLELTTPACPFNDQIEQDVRKAVSKIPGISKVNIKVTARVMEGRALSMDGMLPTVKNIIGVASGKGGVGKTTVSVNLALALVQTGAKVGILDADIYGPSVPLMLGMGKAVMEVENNKLQPADSHGLKVVSFGFFADQEHQAAIYRGPIISGILKQFLVDTNWSELDYLIVDLPPGTGDIPLTLAQTIPITGIVVVTTPQEVASNVAVKAFGMFQKLNIPIMGVIENMSYFVCQECNSKHYLFGQGGAKRMSEKYNLPFLGEIPLNPGIMEGSDSGRPVLVTDPNSPHAQTFMTVAKNVAARCSVIASQLSEEMRAEVATQK